MKSIDLGYIDMLIGFVLLVIPLSIFAYYRTQLIKPIIISIARMTVQLLLVGVYLKYLFILNNAFINVLWVCIMVVIAAYTALKRSNLPQRKLLLSVSLSFFISVSLVGGYFLWIVMKIQPLFDARYFISIFGIILGNILSTNVIALNSYFGDLTKNKPFYHYLLGNGATDNEAQMPFMRQALIESFNPTIANMAVMGLVALPGTMIGQILGGSNPDVSIKYQIMIMIIVFSASTLSVVLSIKMLSRQRCICENL
jgi:putative ABC transport system permease protein